MRSIPSSRSRPTRARRRCGSPPRSRSGTCPAAQWTAPGREGRRSPRRTSAPEMARASGRRRLPSTRPLSTPARRTCAMVPRSPSGTCPAGPLFVPRRWFPSSQSLPSDEPHSYGRPPRSRSGIGPVVEPPRSTRSIPSIRSRLFRARRRRTPRPRSPNGTSPAAPPSPSPCSAVPSRRSRPFRAPRRSDSSQRSPSETPRAEVPSGCRRSLPSRPRRQIRAPHRCARPRRSRRQRRRCRRRMDSRTQA